MRDEPNGHPIGDLATAHTLGFVRSALGDASVRVLEVGCGGGELAAALAGLGHRVVGVESDSARAAEARRRGAEVVSGSWPAEDLVARERGRFDAVLFTRSLHHMRDLTAALAAAEDVLCPRGVLVIEDFAYDAVVAEDVHWLLAQVAALRAVGVVGEVGEESSSAPWAAAGVDAVRAWRDNHHHELHAWPVIEAAVRERFIDVRAETTAYLFRYLRALLVECATEEACAARVCAASLAAERRRTAETGRTPVGRRLIARRRADT